MTTACSAPQSSKLSSHTLRVVKIPQAENATDNHALWITRMLNTMYCMTRLDDNDLSVVAVRAEKPVDNHALGMRLPRRFELPEMPEVDLPTAAIEIH